MHDFSTAKRTGQRILYMLSEYDVKVIIQERRAAGYATHHGNDPREGQIFPGVIVADWGNGIDDTGSANLQVWLDGTDTFWPTSRGRFNPAAHGHYRYFIGSTDHEVTRTEYDAEQNRITDDTEIREALLTTFEPDARGTWTPATT